MTANQEPRDASADLIERNLLEHTTPGPWRIAEFPTSFGLKGPDGLSVASVGFGRARADGLNAVVEGKHADARLIAAAPVLARKLIEAAARIKALEAGLAELVNRLDEVHANSAYERVWVQNHMSSGAYTGPTYVEALDDARTLLASTNGD